MVIHSVKFIASYPEVGQCPTKSLPEFAFIGRSNVGKSSLINFITNVNGLAKVSTRPGKTQLLNYFLVNDKWHLVDLPGYGYAKVSKTAKATFERMIRNYLLQRKQLQYVFLLIDSRIPPQKIDLEFANWLGMNGIPFVIVFTKMDDVKQATRDKQVNDFRKAMLETWEEIPPVFYTSSTKRRGEKEILNFIGEAMGEKPAGKAKKA